ncbi:hypothetical protein OG883_40735 [Streptomyces sp. NBC_01142]|uniref:hypothetical protein n=1 Tax=Streptomyces sp. NBC_01142 TaxID=2975865 RepID=UPI0022507407|nr:hypothetical protein [Streptomyces sp. NBC_01142]MCX4826005.1 hypothetical protein [Streptomyces sp. NBC_01142]
MGLGDVKLAPAIGALLGWSSWTNVWWGTAAGRDRRSQIAFGPFMAIGALAVSLTTI